MSIEDLMNIEITSASRKEQRAEDVAAAVFVITHDDIRRSGMTTMPELLRLVPGVQVAQINSNKWAVSVRGFNALFSNKLLVLVDGRSVYNRIFSGVLWDTEDLMLEDIDRIEVIRGPGAAMWGANAVNGVINIVTKAAADTQGGLVRVEGGRAGEQAGVRYGGTLRRGKLPAVFPVDRARSVAHRAGHGRQRRVAQRHHRVPRRLGDTARRVHAAGRRHGRPARALWPNLDPQTAAREPIAERSVRSQGGHLLGRWTAPALNGASLQVQSFIDVGAARSRLATTTAAPSTSTRSTTRALGARHDSWPAPAIGSSTRP